MENLFSAIMYLVFGKRWIKFSMEQGIKASIFIKRLEIEMAKERHDNAERQLKDLEAAAEKILSADEAKRNTDEQTLAKTQMDGYMAQLDQMYNQQNADKRKLEFISKFKI
jgi:hypothetical protein